MSLEDTGRSYDQIASLWNGEGFLRSNGIEQHLRALAFVKRKRHALDIGCGCSGRFVDLLGRHGFDVEGVDVSDRMIALARQRHPDVTLHHGDIFTTGGLDAPSEKVDSAMGPPMYYSTLGIPHTLRVLSDGGCVCRHLEYDQPPELHLHVIAQKG